MSRLPFRPLLIFCTAVCALNNCGPPPPTNSASSPAKARARKELAISIDGRTVKASVPEPGAILGENGAVMIFSENHRITIGVQRVMADDIEMIQIPAETRNLQMSVSDSGLLTVIPEGARPATMQLPPASRGE